MIRYILNRTLSAIFVLLGISLVSFIIIQLPPGDYASDYEYYLINTRNIEKVDATRMADQLRAQYGLDKPVSIQYLNWIKNIVTKGDFGESFRFNMPVKKLIGQRVWYTLFLALTAHLIATIIGLTLGIYVAQHQYSLADNVTTFISFLLTSIPRFSLALMIVYTMVVYFGDTSVNSFFSPEYVFAPWSLAKMLNFLSHVWAPILIAGLGGLARNIRVMRGNLLDVLNSQYVQTARAKGLKESQVIYRHAVPNALHPVIMYQGMILPYMLQGELEAAIVLGIPTLGPLFYDSLQANDIYTTGALLLLYSFLLVLGNLLADLGLIALDPRIRF